MGNKQFDLRKAFLKAALERGITASIVLANEWFARHEAWNLETEEALRQFKDCLDNHRPIA